MNRLGPPTELNTERDSTTIIGRQNAILHERAQYHQWSGTGALSIKTFSAGRARYESEGRFLVDGDRYLVLNEGQSYRVTIDSPVPVESFCVFFAPGYVEEVYRTLISPPGRLLDDPFPPRAHPLHFFARTYRHDTVLSPTIAALRRATATGASDAAWLEERFFGVAAALLHVHRDAYRQMEQMAPARAATREELYRRLHLARDYAAASYTDPLTLEDMARVAVLSPNHLIRTFKQLFGRTPYQYVSFLRLQAARRLLRATEEPVTDICLAVGFHSLGSFSARFSREFGVSPSAYRAQNG